MTERSIAGFAKSYDPTTPGDWANPKPTTIEEALDRLAAGGGGGALVPLHYTRFVDGATTATTHDGNIESPYLTIAAAAAALSTDLAPQTILVSPQTLSPSYPAAVAISSTGTTTQIVTVATTGGGTPVAGNFTWHADPGASSTVLQLAGLEMGGNFTGTGTGTAGLLVKGPTQQFTAIGGAVDCSAMTGLSSALVEDGTFGGAITLNAATQLNASRCTFQAAVTAGQVTMRDCQVNAAVSMSTGTFDTSQINASHLTASGAVTFRGCRFVGGAQLTGAGPWTFDGPSWAAFKGQNPTIDAAAVIVVEGGYDQGSVLNPNTITATTSISITGTGATAPFTKGGNHYKVAPAADTEITVLSNGALTSMTLRVTKEGTAAFNVSVFDGASSALLGVIPSGSRGFIDVIYNESADADWHFSGGGSL